MLFCCKKRDEYLTMDGVEYPYLGHRTVVSVLADEVETKVVLVKTELQSANLNTKPLSRGEHSPTRPTSGQSVRLRGFWHSLGSLSSTTTRPVTRPSLKERRR